MRHKNFAVFILSHGRPDNIMTLKTLEHVGYTGETYIIVDDEDETRGEYIRRFGDKVLVFNKQEWYDKTDSRDCFKNKASVLYARNASFYLAEKIGLDYFVEFDDDYGEFSYRFANFKFKHLLVKKKIEQIFDLYLDFLDATNCKTIAFAQGGDFIGGGLGAHAKEIHLIRKAMNSFFCSVHNPFMFEGKMNDDVNTYVTRGMRGELFLTCPMIALNQAQTQANKGGLTDIYLDYGTYVKSFYTVIGTPSCCKIRSMGWKERRIHHMIQWDKAVPKIISEKHRRKR